MSQIKACAIVTPSFNQAQFLQQTVASVFAQAEKNPQLQFWYVVMDGGSTDNSVTVLKNFAKKTPKNLHFQYQSKPDKGQTDAINKGIAYFQKNIKATYADKQIAFCYLNSDDVLSDDAVQHVSQGFNKNPQKNWLVGDARIIDGDNATIQEPVRWYKQLLRFKQRFMPWLLFIANPIPQPATWIRWSAVQSIGQFATELYFVMDYQYWLRLYETFGSPIFMRQELAHFRIHGESKGKTGYREQFAEELEVARNFTNNPVLLWLHQMHNQLIFTAYAHLKS